MKRNNLLSVAAMSVLFFAATIWAPIFAQEYAPDQHTLLLLHCNGDLNGAQGETPTQAQGVAFEPGIFGDGAYFSPGNQVYFPSAGNLNSTQGTLEFWIKPRWNGNDGQGYVVLRFGVGGGMLFFKDGGNYWRIILNRFGSNSGPEMDTGIYVGSEWRADQWHHCAFTWNNESLKLYVDGELRTTRKVTIQLPTVNEASIQLGADFSSHYLDAVIDELRISVIARSDKEIQAGFLAGLTISSLSIQPDPLRLVELQQQTLKLTAQTNLGKKAIPSWAAQWSSANPAIATVDENGRVTGIAAGKTTITASFKDVSDSVTVIVSAISPNDLEVMYIERIPKYPRYIAVYQDPTTFTDDWVPYRISVPKGLGGGQTSATQRWPNIGDTVTFIAHVLNHGTTPQSGFSYEWYFDGQSVGSGASAKVLAPYDTAQVAWNWTWDGNRHKVKFVIHGTDDRPTNNALEDFTDALTLFTFIERGHDLKFAAETPNFPNAITSSEIEWFQLHARRMNEMFAAAGSLMRMRYDKLELIPDGAPLFDGDPNAWVFYDGSFPQVLRANEETYRTISGYYDRNEDLDYGLLHEQGHQFGLIDLYRINVDASQNQVTGASRATIPCLMNGVDHFFSEHSALAMNSWHGFRRGYFGTYLYEVPQQNDLRILDVNGDALPEATITIYQKITTPEGKETIPVKPKFTGKTDANGIYRLPNVNIDVSGFVKTETGNIPRPNPFGYISLLGDNGVFLIKIEKDGVCDYQWIDITRFNIAYWQGNTMAATYDIPTNVSTDFELSLPPDLAESSASGWSATPSDGASNVVTFDASRKLFGQNSVKLETTSGFDVWLRYPKNKFARWDLTQKDSLRVWFYAENPSPPGFQNHSPWIRLYDAKCDGGYIEYHATTELLNQARNRWKYFAIPLSGNATWRRTDVGNVSLGEINYLEIHADTWDYGFTLWVDGVGFDPRVGPGKALFISDTSAAPSDTIDVPLNITNASGVAAAQLAVTYDPKILTALGAQTTALTKGFLLADSVSIGKIAIAMARDTSIAGGSGSFVNLTFTVNPTAAPGETAKLTFAKLALFDDKVNPISATPVNGVFTVSGIKSIQILPDSAVFFIKLGGEQVFQAQGLDVNNKPVVVNANWSVDPVELGTFNPTKGDSTTFTALSLGDGVVTAQLGAISTTVEVTVGLLGDISKDSIVDARDAMICLRMIAGLDLPPFPPGHKTPTAYEKWAADFNEDKVINSADALLILRYSLGQLQAAPKIVAGNEDAVLRWPRIEALAGETVTVPILVGQRTDIHAAEFSLSYDPNALTVLGVAPGDSAALMAANTQEVGKIKLAMIAAGGLVGKNGELVKLQFKLQRAHKNESAVSLASFNLFDVQAKAIQARVETEQLQATSLPQSYSLLQNYPNPFWSEAKSSARSGVNPETTIRYQLSKESSVKLQIYNLRGQLIRTLVDAKMKAGEVSTTWDGKDAAGNLVPRGIYFYRLQVNGGEWTSSRKMIVIR